MSIEPKYYTEDIKTVKRIDFAVFTNKEVKSYSAVSNDPFGINLPESYENYEPKKGGLVDLRLGTCDIYLNCTTCGLNSIDCPGHFGHTELAEPVFHYGFFPFLKSILQCICLQCSKILVEKTDELFKKGLNKKSEIRFKEIKNLTKNTNYCYTCGTPVGKIKKEEKESTASLRLILERDIGIQSTDDKTGNVSDMVKKTTKILTPRDCYNILRNLSETDCYILGFNPTIARPEDLIIEKFPIPPVIIRPTAKIDFMQSSTMEDSLTLKIADIINANKRVRSQLDKKVVSNELSTYNQDISNLLQFHIITYFDNESVSLPRSEFKSGSKPTKSISVRIKSKGGRVRSNLMGKRVDFSARSVITSDPNINIDEVGIPKKIAIELTIPEEVTPFNIKHLTELVRNGRDEYPGANFVFRTIYKDGKPEIQKIDLKYRKKSIKLNIGDVVERHSVNGDYVLFNRQPTLHKPSMMGHKIHVLDRDDVHTFRVNVSVCKPYNADFDGDEMNIHMAQSVQARNELKRIANVKYQIIGAKNSNPIIGCVQDALSGSYLLTKLNNSISGADVSNFLCTTTSDTKYEIDKNKRYTGHEIFSHIIPKGINNIIIKNGKKVLEIINGELLIGTLDKNTLSTVKNSIIHFIWDKYGPDKTRRFIDDAQRLALMFLNYRGFTMGIKDCISDPKTEEQVNILISNKILEYKIALTQYENDIEQIDVSIIEADLSAELNSFSSDIGNMLLKSLGPDNNLFVCIDSKSKGDAMNLQHIMGCVGQKSIEGSRIKKKIENRTLTIFHKDDDTPEARGFIKNSYLKGLNSYEFFYDAMSGREGLIDTAIKTAKVGYIQRQLIKGLEDLIIKYDNTNRNAKNIIIQYIYGENGIEQSSQTELAINLVALNNIEIEQTYGFNEDEIKKIEKEHKIKNINNFNKQYIDKIKKYRDELRVIQSIANNNYKTLEEKYMLPVNLKRLTQFYSKNKVNLELKPEDIVIAINNLLDSPDTRLIAGLKHNDTYLLNDDRQLKYLLEIAIHDYICPKKCIFEYGLSKNDFNKLIADIKINFIKAIVHPGEMVGVVAAQSIGEPILQMSLLGNESNKIVIKNKITNDIVMVSTEIGTFCDNIINNYPQLTFNTGHINSVETDLETLENEYYIIGVDSKEKTHWNKISHISRHPVNGSVMKITTKSGRTVHTTTSHSHLIRKNQTVEPIEGCDMKIGMRIPVAKHIDDIFIKKNIEIEGTAFKLDYLFGWFIGAYLAEDFNSNIKFEELFDTIIHADKINSECSFTRFNCNQLYELVVGICCKNSLIKNIPDFAFIAPNEFKSGLIQAYFDVNCNFQPNDLNYQFSICSQNKQLIKDMALLLNYFDIFGTINSNSINGSNIYNLDIPTKYSILYKQHIGTIVYVNKLNTIVNYVSSNIVLDDDIDKINGLGEIINKCNKVLNLSIQNNNIDIDIDTDRYTLNKYIEIFEGNKDSHIIIDELTILKQALNSNVIWDEVIDIEIYTIKETDYVYDFTVPSNQTFMTDYGIIVHNTLNTKHSAGVASKSTTNMGVGRIEEILHYSKDIKTPQMTVYFDDKISNDRSKINKIASYFNHLTIKELITSAEIIYNVNANDDISKMIKADNVSTPFFINNQKTELSTMPFVFRIKLNMEIMHDKETTLLDIKTKFISNWSKNFTNFKNMKKVEKDIFSKISRCAILSNTTVDNQIIHIRFNMSSFNYNLLTDFLKIVLTQISLKGIDNIKSSDMTYERKLRFNKDTGDSDVSKEYIVYTAGINFEKLKYIKGINHRLSCCNDISTIYRLYGIESVRQILINELNLTFNAGGSSSNINNSHMTVLIDMMTHTGGITSIDRHGLGKIDSEPIAKASFEKTMEHFLNAAIFNEKDNIESVSSRVMLGRVIPGGTGCFELLLDTNKLENSEYTKNENGGRITFIGLEEEALFNDVIKFGFTKNDFFLPV